MWCEGQTEGPRDATTGCTIHADPHAKNMSFVTSEGSSDSEAEGRQKAKETGTLIQAKRRRNEESTERQTERK